MKKASEQYIDMNIHNEINALNALTGNSNLLYNRLKASIAKAKQIDIIVSFLMESGVKMIVKDLKEAIERGAKVRILTGNYLGITQPQALYLLRKELGDRIALRFYNVPNKSFHPKAYIFHYQVDGEIYVGSSNLSRGALTTSIEWNYRFSKSVHEEDFNYFYGTFCELFEEHAIEITDEVLRHYSKSWKQPKFVRQMIEESEEKQEVTALFEPRGAQIEALYALEQSREEGFDKGLVVAATGIGKTYLAAFDSRAYQRVLFVAHREEIIKQAAQSFRNVRPDKSIGFFYGDQKQTDTDFVFALVQTLGKKTYLNETYFAPDAFDYIVVDEFHHAVAGNYKGIIEYFKPKFLLGLTATPERLDNKDVFALCDYNSVYEIRLKEAINKGWLVPFKYYGIYDDTVDYTSVHMRNGKYDEKELEEKLMIHQRAELVFKHYMKYQSKCAMGFCASKGHAEYMAKYFNQQGVAAVAVYSGTQGEHTSERNEAVNKLKKGEIKIIFSVDMFNEGVDVPAIDTVLFLRPTESPTIFLQQLGRGLRRFKNKEYLNVLDFIGNYKKANLIPFLLSGKDYDGKAFVKGTPMEFEYPDECHIDFDFRLIDLFKKQSESELNAKDRILQAYQEVKEALGHRPSRVELLLHMDEEVLAAMKKTAKLNVFRDYMNFLYEHKELTDEESLLYHTRAREFLNMLETTAMSKSYKMPILQAFYNHGEVRTAITEDDVYKAMKDFYSLGSNGVDMLKDKRTSTYKTWEKKDYVKLAKDNPIKFLKQSANDFFIEKEGYVLALPDEMKQYIIIDSFKAHFNDIIEFRVLNYYRDRFQKQG